MIYALVFVTFLFLRNTSRQKFYPLCKLTRLPSERKQQSFNQSSPNAISRKSITQLFSMNAMYLLIFWEGIVYHRYIYLLLNQVITHKPATLLSNIFLREDSLIDS